MLPEEPIQFDTSKRYIKKKEISQTAIKYVYSQDESATTSEVSTPITFFSTPEHNKDEIDTVNILNTNLTWSHSLFFFLVAE